MRPLLIITFLSVVLAGEPTSAQHYFTPPTSGQSYSSPGYGYFTPPAAPNRRPKSGPAIAAKIPEPETTTISEEYAKGSIVIINHERALYFVDRVSGDAQAVVKHDSAACARCQPRARLPSNGGRDQMSLSAEF
jgi:hypothetical protein